MSNRLFQGIIQQMKESIDRVFGIIDENSIVIACSELGRIGETVDVSFAANGEVAVADKYTYKSMGTTQSTNYTVFVEGDDILASKYIGVLAVCFSNIKFYYDEKYDRSNFIKNVILLPLQAARRFDPRTKKTASRGLCLP